jgi:hypothetical protein
VGAFRELAYGVLMFLCALGGASVVILLAPLHYPMPSHTPQPFNGVPVIEAITGAILGTIAWLAYKRLVVTNPKR